MVGIEAHIVMARIAPVAAGESAIIVCAALIHPAHLAARFGFGKARTLHQRFYAHFLGRMNKYAQHVRPVAQNEVRAASDHHAAFVFGKAEHHLGLIAKQIFVRDKIVAVRRDHLAVIGVFGHAEEQAVAEAFFRIGKQLFVDAAVVRRHAQNIAVVKRDAEASGQRFADGASAAAVFPGDGNHIVFHAASPFLPDKPPENRAPADAALRLTKGPFKHPGPHAGRKAADLRRLFSV